MSRDNPKTANKAAKPRPIVCRITRRDQAGDAPRHETFEVDLAPTATLHELLLAIAKSPIPRGGVRVSPPAWDAHCLEGSCGGCALRAGGRAVLACTTRIDEVALSRGAIVLEPMEVFPIVRDLVVDHTLRDRDIDARSAVSAIVSAGGEGAAGAKASGQAPVLDRAALGACIACGACLDACPEASADGGFVGAEAIVRNRRAHASPAASPAERDALDAALMRPGGISECGNAQNCIETCPADVPIREALADAARAASSHLLRRWLRR